MACWVSKKYKDDISPIETLISCDDCKLIKKIDNWEIELTPDKKLLN